MITKQFNWMITLTFLTAILITACQKDNLTESSFDNYEYTDIDLRDNEETNGVKCYAWNFPVTLQYGEGDTIVIDSKEALIDFTKDWRASNPGAKRPRVKLPAEVTLADGTVVTIEEGSQLREIARGCKKRKVRGHVIRHCFDLIYGVTIEFPDGTSETYDDQESHLAAMKQWREDNPDATERPKISLPQDVELTDGNVITIETPEQFKELAMQCFEDSPHGPCIKPVFPLTIDLPEGTSEVVADAESFRAAIQAWKEANPDASDRPEISFPHDVELASGETVTLENKEQAQKLIALCRLKRKGPNLIDNNCFTLDFPVKFKVADGVIVGVADLEALKKLHQNHPGRKHHKLKNYPRIVVPFNVTMKDSGLSVTVDSFEDLKNLFNECREG